MVSWRRRVGRFVAVGLLLAAPAARAQSSNEAAATALFDEGRKLMGERRWADACPKLAESQRIAPSGGTLLNLAECYEHTGQTASAWASWKDAAARANAAGKADVERRALARATALEPALAKLTIAVEHASDVAGLEIKRDDIAVGRAEFGTAIPVDPGMHVVQAIAPGKKPFLAKLEISAKQTDARVTVQLEDEPQVAPAPPPEPPPMRTPVTEQPPISPASPSSGGSAQKTIGIVIGAVGVAGLATGATFGLIAKSKNDQALQNCRTPTLCSPTGLSLTSDAKDAATVSTVAFIAGGALVAGGLVVWLSAPAPSSRTGVRLAPAVTASYGGVSLDGAF
jgi:hypothetical protein